MRVRVRVDVVDAPPYLDPTVVVGRTPLIHRKIVEKSIRIHQEPRPNTPEATSIDPIGLRASRASIVSVDVSNPV